MTMPGIDHRRPTGIIARHPFVFRARDLSLTARSGQVGTLVRTVTAVATDINGIDRTLVHSQPRWNHRLGVFALRLGGGVTEYAHWDCPVDALAMSIFVDYQDYGSIVINPCGIFQLTTVGSANPRLYLRVSGSVVTMVHHNGTSSVTVAMATGYNVDDRVRLRGWVFSDGSIRLWQSVNGAAETSTSQSAALALASWATPTKVMLNSIGGVEIGQANFVGAAVMRGNQSQSTLMEAVV